MTTEKTLTNAEIFDCFDKSNGTVCIEYYPDELFEMGRAIEQAVLQSEQVQAWKRDAERYRWVERQSDAWAVLGAAYDLSSEYDGVANLSESIDAAMEQQA